MQVAAAKSFTDVISPTCMAQHVQRSRVCESERFCYQLAFYFFVFLLTAPLSYVRFHVDDQQHATEREWNFCRESEITYSKYENENDEHGNNC